MELSHEDHLEAKAQRWTPDEALQVKKQRDKDDIRLTAHGIFSLGYLEAFTTSREHKSGTEATSRIYLTQAVWKKKKKKLATNKITKQNR